MEQNSKYNGNNLLKYLMYFKNTLSGKERHAFEKNMMQDKFEEEAFEGLSRLSYEELNADLSELQGKLKRKEPKKGIISLPVFRYAAGIIALLGIGALIYILTLSVPEATKIAESIKQEDSLRQEIFTKSPHDSLDQGMIAQDLGVEKRKERESAQYTPPIIMEVPEIEYALSDDNIEIEEVPVIGYGVTKEERIDAGLETENDVAIRNEVSADQALQGLAAGVTVADSKSTPGSETKIQIRGISSIDRSARTIQGKVVSATDGQPLPGVTVSIIGSSVAVITDVNGNFLINMPSDEVESIQFSYIGYITDHVEVVDDNTLNVAMAEDLVALDEVVVIGYGVQKKSDMTGAISSVQSEDLSEESAESPIIIQPEPIGGMREFRRYIEKNINYDNLPEFEDNEIVKLSFTVETNGSLSNIIIDKSAGTEFDDEAIRLLKTGPGWISATRNGIPFSKEVNLRIRFKPKEK